MVIGEQLNHQQAQQQIVVATNHRTTTTSSSQNHIHSATSNLPGQNTPNIISEGSNNNNNNLNLININTCNNLGTSSDWNHNNNGNIIGIGGLVGGGTSTASAKNQLELLHTMREALFSQDGWGCQHVNQDTNWEVPSSPEPTNKDPSSGPPLWKPTINNGTDLWESNLRNGGQPPAQSIQKTPWGHTPSSNLGGTWGEDDDGSDSTSVWTGASNNSAATTGNIGNVVGVVVPAGGAGGAPNTAQQWGGGGQGGAVGVGVGATSSTNVNVPGGGVGGTSTGGVTGAGVGASGNGWGDPRELRTGPMGGGSIDIRSVDPRDSMRAASAGDPRDLRILDPRDPIRGDPRGISGRLNGTSEMWGQHHSIAHNQMTAMNKMIGGPGGGVGGSSGGTNVGPPVVAGSAVTSIGPSGVGVGNVVNNVNAQWAAAAQTVVGPKDINSIGGKQVSGWEEPSPPPQRRNIQNYDDGTSLWGQQSRVPGGGSHWKEMSDPMNRNHLMRNTINSQNTANSGIVPGLSGGGVSSGLGGNNQSGGGGIGGTPSGGIGVTGNPNAMVGPQGRLTTGIGPGSQHKPDGAMWVHPNNGVGGGRNAGGVTTGWGDDSNHNVGATPNSNWDDKTSAGIGQLGANVVGSGNSWNDAPNSWNKAQNKISSGAGSWGTGGAANDVSDLNNDWTMHSGIVGKQQQKLNSGVGVNVGAMAPNIDIIKQSKQYRILVDTGFKKDDIERALISANMNIQEAAEILHPNAIDSWRRHDETLGSYADHPNSNNVGGGGFPGRYPTASAHPTMSIPPNNHMLNNMSGSALGAGTNNPNLAAINAMQPLQVQKYLAQAPHNVGGAQSVNPVATVAAFGGQNTANVNAGTAINANNQPSAQQLRMLVQQIQLAVHSGYLSSQILNQPLAPATLLLLNQLLSNIKHLQGAQQSLSRGNNVNNLQLNVAVNKYKQQIQNLQNQINAQQAIYIKQQQQQHPVAVAATHVNISNTEYLRGQHDAISALQGNFTEMNLNKPGYQGAPNQQSRLNQWKLPVLEKDMATDSTDFSRAPGATKQSLSASNVNNMGPLGLQNDGTWSAGRNIGDGWPESSNDNENKDWSVAQPTSATAYTDLVQEFEPGKPWKGAQIKSIEDDPSITPGSVARSPLSINPTPKEADIFSNAGKNSPTDLPTLSLSSSTWSFNPSSSNQNFPSWSDNPQQCATSELWSASMNKTSRGPPPGLGTNKGGGVAVQGVSAVTNPSSVVSGNSNGWLVASSCGAGGVPGTNANWGGTNSSWNSNWLLLKNLTAQIDGSTLRTLCIQHGPLITFHLYLNQGIALCKYATREEANKAQMTLNNCVLGNTTICAESPNETEVQNILQHLPQTNPATVVANGSSNSGGTNAGGGNNTSNGNNGSGNVNTNTVGGNNGNSLVNGTCNSVNNAASNAAVGNIQSVNACNTNNGGGGNTGTNSNNSTGNSNNVSAGGNANNSTNVVWRQVQNQQQQQQQNQNRPARETDFDYISKYVCSIVDD